MFLPSTNAKAVLMPHLMIKIIIHCGESEAEPGEAPIIHVENISFLDWNGGERAALNPFVSNIERYIGISQPVSPSSESKVITLRTKYGTLRQPADIDCLKNSLLTFPPVTRLRVQLVHKNHSYIIELWKRHRLLVLKKEQFLTFVDLFDLLERHVAHLGSDEMARRFRGAPQHTSFASVSGGGSLQR
jgi:hypothetical protein